MEIIVVPNAESQVSKQFIQGMVNRMCQGLATYGPITKERMEKINMIKSLEQRIEKYKETGNTEWLMDAANYCMMEFMFPNHPNGHFKATSSRESPGYTDNEGDIRKS